MDSVMDHSEIKSALKSLEKVISALGAQIIDLQCWNDALREALRKLGVDDASLCVYKEFLKTNRSLQIEDTLGPEAAANLFGRNLLQELGEDPGESH